MLTGKIISSVVAYGAATWIEYRNSQRRIREIRAQHAARVTTLEFQLEVLRSVMTSREKAKAEEVGDCRHCNPNYTFMRLCPRCGNKRCPKADWHIYACTGSNESGQVPILESLTHLSTDDLEPK